MFILLFILGFALGSSNDSTQKPPAENNSSDAGSTKAPERPDSKPTMSDLNQALDTEELFWLNKRNYSAEEQCSFWFKLSLRDSKYIFLSRHKNGEGQIKQTKLTAKLLMKTDGPTMRVRSRGQRESEAIPYVLKFWTLNETCAIFTYPDGKCEQRVWNQNVRSPLPSCDRAYCEFCGSTSIHVYNRTCVDPDAV
uniref:Lipocalin n=1 Tax=Hyalomma excavatum TaxID=257692 RepID=A0A131XIF5_9ACAR